MSNEVRNVSISISASGSTFDANNIIRVDMQRGITDGGFGIGFTQSDMLRFTAVSAAKLAKKTLCTVTISPGGRFGNYYVEECTRDGSMINVTAYDAMYYQGKAHVRFGGKASMSLEPLTFPCTMQDVLDYVCALRRIPCSFQCQDFTIPKKPKKPDGTYFTVRELIGFIAASHGCNAKFNDQGVLEFRGFSESSEELTASDVVDITIDDGEPFEVTGLLFYVDSETDVYIDDVPGSTFDEDDDGVIKCYNPLVTVDSEGNCPVANYAWSQISGSRLSYYSGSITKRGSGTIKCGDVLTVKDLKYPADDEDYMICITDISYSISADTGFMETLTSQADKNDNGSPPTSSSKTKSYGTATDPTQATGADVKLDDLWFKTDNNGKLQTVYTYTMNVNTNAKEWAHVCTADSGGSGGVGENVGNHNERFNGYENGVDGNIIANGDYNHAEGYKNIMQSYENYSHAEGYMNTMQGGTYNHVEGSNNTVSGSNRTHVGGMNNNVTGASCSTVNGAYNTAAGSISYSGIFGNANEVHNLYSVLVVGGNNYAAGASGAIVCGQFADTRLLNIPLGENLRFLVGGSDNSANRNVFYITHLGEVYAKGAYNTMGADYAEYFEWADGNPENEDRRGLLVALDGDKIVPADGYDVLGVISASPSVIGNGAFLYWQGKFIHDAFGSIMFDDSGEPLINPDFDPEREYIPRADRPEWAAVGLVGRLIVCDNGKCKKGDFICADEGYAFPCLVGKTNIRCLKRVDDSHIEVLIR